LLLNSEAKSIISSLGPLGRLEADDIFVEYQQQATAGELKFRRWPLRSHKCRGALLTNYFSQNCMKEALWNIFCIPLFDF
jgi:hypothetical protein